MTIERVFVAGAGLMGHGIAQVLAAAERRVDLYEPELARAIAGRDRIAVGLERLVAVEVSRPIGQPGARDSVTRRGWDPRRGSDAGDVG